MEVERLTISELYKIKEIVSLADHWLGWTPYTTSTPGSNFKEEDGVFFCFSEAPRHRFFSCPIREAIRLHKEGKLRELIETEYAIWRVSR